MIIDLIICVVVLISALVAFFRGFIREVLTILGVIGGLAAAYAFGASLAPFYNSLMGVDPNVDPEEAEKFLGLVNYPTLSIILGYVTVFLLVVILLGIFSYFLSKFVENIGMGMVDRTLGVVFGIARGVILLGVIYLPVHMFVDKKEKEEWFKDSRLQIYIEWTADWLAGFLPEDFVEQDLQESTDKTRETLKALEILPETQKLMSTGDDANGSSEGYNNTQRKSMESLIENQEQTQKQGDAGNE